jgi:hypothetical protein
VPLIKRRESICSSCLETGGLPLFFSSVDLFMAGHAKTFILDVIRKARPSAFLSSKMATALVVSPMLSGHLTMCALRTLELCCLISLARGAIRIQKKDMR